MVSQAPQQPVPKCWQLIEYFHQQIVTGVLRPGDQLPSHNEMRLQHGASRPTVDKIHSVLEQEGLIERRRGLGIFVASVPNRTVTGVIGLSGHGFSFKTQSSYWSNVMTGICEAAESAGQQILLLGFESNKNWEKVDGVLISDWVADFAMLQRPPQLPCVSVLAPHNGIASVRADDYAGMRMATKYLISLGHRNIAYLHANLHQPVMVERLKGYHDALKDAGIFPNKLWQRQLQGACYYGAYFVKESRRNMHAWLKDDWHEQGCTALICQNDETAVGAMAALAEAGIRVPHDVSVIGFDGTEACEMTSPLLTTVQLPLQQIGSQSVALLMQQITSDTVSYGHQVLSPTLRIGESCAAPR